MSRDAAPEPRARTVACPACGLAAVFSPQNPWRPFCSERCRLVDLGAWASESYRIPERPAALDEGGGDSPEANQSDS